MSIKDAIKKSVLQEFTDPAVTMGDIAAALGMAAVLALYIYLIYKLVTRSAFYSRDFNKSLAMLPVITSTVAVIPMLFMGSLIMENFFGIPGLGSYTIDAINAQDFSVVRAMVFLGTAAYILGLILTDVAYTVVDPRIRLK